MSLQLEWVGLKKKVLSFQFDEPASFIKETHKTNGGWGEELAGLFLVIRQASASNNDNGGGSHSKSCCLNPQGGAQESGDREIDKKKEKKNLHRTTKSLE